MKAETLRKSLLQTAVEGKLVPQLAEEPEVVPIHDAPSEVPFAVPEKWKWVRIEDICLYVQRGKSPKYSPIEKIPVVAQKCNQWDGFHIEKAQFIDPSTFPSYKEERKLKDGDVLWNSTGLGSLGRLAVYEEKLNPYGIAVADSHVTVMRTDPSRCDFRYLYWYLRSNYIQSNVESWSSGSTKQKELSVNTIRNVLVPLPPLKEQYRIISMLSDILSLVNIYAKEKELMDELESEFPRKLRFSLLQEAVEGKLVPQLDNEPEVAQIGDAPAEEPFSIPPKWKWVELHSIVPYGVGTQVSPEIIPEESWILDLEDIEKETGCLLCKKRGVKVRSNKVPFKKGDVLYGKLRPYLNKVIVADEDGYCTGEIVPLHVGEKERIICPEFLRMVLMSPFFVHYAVSCSYGVKMPRLGTKDGRKAPVPLPPLPEQYRILAKLRELLPLVDQLPS